MTINLAGLKMPSKTTMQGLLGCTITCIVAYVAMPPGLKPPMYALAVLRAIVGFYQKDAGEVLATTPTGEATVASHELPDDPANKPVV